MKLRLPVVLIFLSLFTLIVFCLYYFLQPFFTYSACPLCDGNQYLNMYHFFKGASDEYTIAFPYYSRVIVPFMASLLSLNEDINNFQLLNLVFSLLSVGTLVYLWKKVAIPDYLILIGFGWLLFHWPGIIRLNAVDPLNVDVPTYFIQALFILIFLSRKFHWLWLLAPIAIFQKESFNALLISFLIYSFIERKYYGQKIPLYNLLGPLCLSLLLKFVFTLQVPPWEVNDKTAIETVVLSFISIVQDPVKLVRWLVALFTAFGPLLILAILNIKTNYKREPLLDFLSIMSLTYLGLGLFAGGDMTRIIFLGFPFIMTWILYLLKEVDVRKVFLAIGLSLFIMRIFEIIPDAGKDFPTFATWFPEYAPVKIVLLWGAYFIGCFVVLYQSNKVFKAK